MEAIPQFAEEAGPGTRGMRPEIGYKRVQGPDRMQGPRYSVVFASTKLNAYPAWMMSGYCSPSTAAFRSEFQKERDRIRR
jgi:hypothetical protein